MHRKGERRGDGTLAVVTEGRRLPAQTEGADGTAEGVLARELLLGEELSNTLHEESVAARLRKIF